MDAIDLFSGCGALSHGMAGILRSLQYVEYDLNAQATLRKLQDKGLIDRAPIHGDISAFDAKPFAERPESRPLAVIGGWPCVGFSTAGSRRGYDNAQSGLFREFVRVVRESKADVVFQENVAALCSAPGGLKEVCEEMSRLGYHTVWTTMFAWQVGAPQRRRRWYAVSYKPEAVGVLRLVIDRAAYTAHAWSGVEPCPRMINPTDAEADAETRAAMKRSHRLRQSRLGNAVVPDAVRSSYLYLLAGATTPVNELLELDEITVQAPAKTRPLATPPSADAEPEAGADAEPENVIAETEDATEDDEVVEAEAVTEVVPEAETVPEAEAEAAAPPPASDNQENIPPSATPETVAEFVRGVPVQGWETISVARTAAGTATMGRVDKFYKETASGKRFRSILEVERYVNGTDPPARAPRPARQPRLPASGRSIVGGAKWMAGGYYDGESYWAIPPPHGLVRATPPDLGIVLKAITNCGVEEGGLGNSRSALVTQHIKSMWATPRHSVGSCNVLTSRSKQDLCTQVRAAADTPDILRPGWTNAEWVEWLMGLPAGWTEFDVPAAAPVETQT